MILGVPPEQVEKMPLSKLDMGVQCIRSVNNKFARLHGSFNAPTEEKQADLTTLTLIEFQQFFDKNPDFGPATWRADLPPAYTTNLGFIRRSVFFFAFFPAYARLRQSDDVWNVDRAVGEHGHGQAIWPV
jgi:hypothetical protein